MKIRKRKMNEERNRAMKKYQLSRIVVVLSLCQMCNAALIASWNFDNSSDLGNDSAGNFDLTAIGSGTNAPVYSTTGKVGGAAYFDGSTSGYITPTNIYATPSFTFAAWIKPDNTNVTSIVAPMSSRAGFQVYAAGGSWRARINKQDATYAYKIFGPVVEDEWAHLAVSFTSASGPDAYGNYKGYLRLYLNGTYVTGISSTNYCPNTSYTMKMGANSSLAYFVGLMDEVQLYNTALSADEITALAIPEPATISMLSLGGLALFFHRLRLRK